MVDEALVLGAVAVIAGVLLVVGLIQALRTPPRRRLRRGRFRGRSRVQVRRGDVRERPAFPGSARAPVAPPPRSAEPARASASVEEAPVAEPELLTPPDTADSHATAPAEPAGLPLEECFALYEAKQYHELIMLAEPELERAGESAGYAERVHELAPLWGLVGLSRQALKDEEGAYAAFEAAIRVAPEGDRSRYQSYLAALIASMARQLLERADAFGEAAEEERLGTLRQAVLWLRQGLIAAPGDETVSALLDRVREGLWVAYSRVATTLIGRREFRGARQLLVEALGDDEVPADWREAFQGLRAVADTGEVGKHHARPSEDEREREAEQRLIP